MKIEVAKEAGYCYGVERALRLVEEARESLAGPIFTLGPLIHNPQAVAALKSKEIFPLKNFEDLKEGTVIISSHGISPQIVKKIKKIGLKVIDATCPYVKKAQAAAEKLVKEGYKVVVVGDANHPEVKGILARAKDEAQVVGEISDLKKIPPVKKIGVVVQTTQSIKFLKEVVSKLTALEGELRVFNTICDATVKRQEAARDLSRRAQVMLVVGGRNSANTSRLAEICRQTGTSTYHLEVASEIKPVWFKEDGLVGVTAGASTPDWILQEVLQSLEDIRSQKLNDQ